MINNHLSRVLSFPILAAFSPFFITSCSGLVSDLTVPAGETFVLGGGEKGAFTVKARNTGTITVSLSSRNTKGGVTDLGTLAPRASQTLTFQEGEAALILNAAAVNARLMLNVTGKVPSGMGYEKPTTKLKK
jgi:hypothetical protein